MANFGLLATRVKFYLTYISTTRNVWAVGHRYTLGGLSPWSPTSKQKKVKKSCNYSIRLMLIHTSPWYVCLGSKGDNWKLVFRYPLENELKAHSKKSKWNFIRKHASPVHHTFNFGFFKSKACKYFWWLWVIKNGVQGESIMSTED